MQDILLRLKTLMDQKGINAKQLTKELGISSSSFTDWNKGKGKPSAETLVKFSEYFNVSLDWLIVGKQHNDILDSSNHKEQELLNKFRLLKPELQTGVLMYIDGLLAASQNSEQEPSLSNSKVG